MTANEEAFRNEIVKLITDNKPLTLNDIKVAIYESQDSMRSLFEKSQESLKQSLEKSIDDLRISTEKSIDDLRRSTENSINDLKKDVHNIEKKVVKIETTLRWHWLAFAGLAGIVIYIGKALVANGFKF